MIIIGIYWPHSGTILDFTEQLDGMCDLPFVQNSKFVILAGVFNINILDNSSFPVSNFMSPIQSKYFIPTINKATKFESDTTSTCLDHIWMNSTTHVNSGVIYYDQTDHCPTFMNFIPPKSFKSNHYISYSLRPYSESNEENIIEKLTIIDASLPDILPSDIVDNMLQKFSSSPDELYCQSFPKKTKQLTYKRLNNPWLTSHLIQQIKLKSEYYKLYRRGLMSKATNNRFRNLVNKQVLEAKQKYYQQIFSNCRSSMRKSWDTIKRLLGKQNNQTKIKEMLINDEIVYDESQIISGLNEYFSTIGSKLDQQLPAHTNPIPVRQ